MYKRRKVGVISVVPVINQQGSETEEIQNEISWISHSFCSSVRSEHGPAI